MMDFLLKKATVLDPTSSYHKHRVDVLISDGIIKDIDKNLKPISKVFEYDKDYFISPGWLDIYANFSDPGFENNETLLTGAKAAAAGGYTDVFICPDTLPRIDHISVLDYIKQKTSTKNFPVEIRAIGSLLKENCFAEIYDLADNGIVAFTNGDKVIKDSSLFLKSLEYAKPSGLPILKNVYPSEIMGEYVSAETPHNYSLGLKGIPWVYEKNTIQQDLNFAEYTHSKMLFLGTTSPKSIDLIANAKKKLKIACSTPFFSLCFDDETLDSNYNTNYKVLPPLGSKKSRQKLCELFENGKLDFLYSHHTPLEYDFKETDFDSARFGMSTIQYTFSLMNTYLPKLNLERWVEAMAIKNRKFFKMTVPSIEKKQIAKLTLFDSEKEYIAHPKNDLSLSSNFPLFGSKLKGKVLGTFFNQQMRIF